MRLPYPLVLLTLLLGLTATACTGQPPAADDAPTDSENAAQVEAAPNEANTAAEDIAADEETSDVEHDTGADAMADEGAPAPKGADDAVEVRVTASDFAFECTQTEFETGVPYRFVIENTGAVAHEWVVMPASSAAEGADGDVDGPAEHMDGMMGDDGHAEDEMHDEAMHEDEHADDEMHQDDHSSPEAHATTHADHMDDSASDDAMHHEGMLVRVGDDELVPDASVTIDYVFTEPGAYEFQCHLPGHQEAGMVLPVRVVAAGEGG